MRFQFRSKKIQSLYTEEKGAHKYPEGVVKAFFEAMAVISSARDERDIRALKLFRYEKLKGSRRGEHSICLNDQFRLTFQERADEGGKCLQIIDIEDYH